MNLLDLLGIKEKVLSDLSSLKHSFLHDFSVVTEENPCIDDCLSSSIVRIQTLKYIINNNSLINLFQKINCSKKFFWKNATDDFKAIGAGSIDNITTRASYMGIRFYAARFDCNAPIADEWKEFGTEIDIIPQWGIVQTKSQELFINFDESILELEIRDFLNMFELVENKNNTDLMIHETTFIPDYEGWSSGIARAVACFKSGEARKIVLARRAEMELPECRKPEMILTKLYQSSENSYCWYYQVNNSIAFMGASPEKLFSSNGNKISVDGLAGTIRRDSNEQTDSDLAEQLLCSGKDLHEHKVVVEYIVERLNSLCENVKLPPNPVIKKLRTVQHLFTPIQGELKSEINWTSILDELHPTPAVGGDPKAIAMKLIREIEGYDRGLYAGPIGIVSNSNAELAVGIRSGLFNSGKLYLYSGAGIVPDSTPHEEWQEINNKQKNFLSIFDSDNE